MKKTLYILVISIINSLLCANLHAESYVWKSIKIGAGGVVPGIIAHPAVPGLFYIRTDIGGAYRWDQATEKWIPLMDKFSWDQPYMSVESIALAPGDPNLLYAFVGNSYDSEHAFGRLLKSTDRGDTWQETSFHQAAYGNGKWRWAGERMAIDPVNRDIVYVGTRKAGLWKSADGAVTFTRVQDVPPGDTSDVAGAGVSFVVFVPVEETDTRKATRTLFVGVMGEGVFRSADEGQSWKKLSGGPDPDRHYPLRAAAARGIIYITYSDAASPYGYGKDTGYIFRCTAQGELTDITPDMTGAAREKTDFCGITVNPTEPDKIAAIAFPGGTDAQTYRSSLFHSEDGGRHWNRIAWKDSTWKEERPWMQDPPADYTPGWTTQVLFDPHHPSTVWLTEGASVYRAEDIYAHPPTWTSRIQGLEELCAEGSLSVPGGALFTYVADKAGFKHRPDWAEYPEYKFKEFDGDDLLVGKVSGMDFCEKHPEVIVRVGGSGCWLRNGGYPRAKRSVDGGASWRDMNCAGGSMGKIAVSATDPNSMVWAPLPDTGDQPGRGHVWYSKDAGQTWKQARGEVPDNCFISCWERRSGLVSDRVAGKVFYLFGKVDQSSWKFNDDFYRSLDGGETWTKTHSFGLYSGVLPNNSINVKTAPFIAGTVWVGLGSKGLFVSTDYGHTFMQLPSVQTCLNFGFGKNPPGQTIPTAFLLGKLGEDEGLFRTDDLGKSWVKIADKTGHAFAAEYILIAGDRNEYGEVIIGTGGRGFFYGRMEK